MLAFPKDAVRGFETCFFNLHPSIQHQKTTRSDMDKDRKAFEHKIDVESDAVNTEVELRTRELLRLRDEKQQEQEKVETRQDLEKC